MSYKSKAYPKFNRIKKKLPKLLREEIDIQVEKICANPAMGETKRGDLAEVRVCKFHFLKEEYLLAYTVEEREKE